MTEEPFYKKHPELCRSEFVTWCNNCKDTAFEMCNKKTQESTHQCARCGKQIGKEKNAYR